MYPLENPPVRKEFITTDPTFYDESTRPVEYFSARREKVNAANEVEVYADFGFNSSPVVLDWEKWLPFASKFFEISNDPRDYILVPVPTIISDLPNRNAVGFPIQELLAWNRDVGRQSYKSWVGQPIYVEHEYESKMGARGIILDAMIRPLLGFADNKLWKVVKLLAIDRTKDLELAKGVLSRERNSYSMGAYVSGYKCSYCEKMLGKCSHIDHRSKGITFYELEGKLVYKMAVGISGYEVSAVEDPAWRVAISNKLLIMS